MPEFAFCRSQPSSFLYRHRPCYRAACDSRSETEEMHVSQVWSEWPYREERKCTLCPVLVGRSRAAITRLQVRENLSGERAGRLNKFEQKRRGKEIIAEFGANSEATLREAEAVNLGTTFQQQSERWLKSLQTRKRNPIKPRTALTWASYLS